MFKLSGLLNCKLCLCACCVAGWLQLINRNTDPPVSGLVFNYASFSIIQGLLEHCTPSHRSGSAIRELGFGSWFCHCVILGQKWSHSVPRFPWMFSQGDHATGPSERSWWVRELAA